MDMTTSMPSMGYFMETTTNFIVSQIVGDFTEEEIIEQVEWFIVKTGGWEAHYGMMFEGLCKGVSLEDQLKQTEALWKTIKFKFGG